MISANTVMRQTPSAWQAGYDYAAKEITKGPVAIEKLRHQSDGAISCTDFDRGCWEALRVLAPELENFGF